MHCNNDAAADIEPFFLFLFVTKPTFYQNGGLNHRSTESRMRTTFSPTFAKRTICFCALGPKLARYSRKLLIRGFQGVQTKKPTMHNVVVLRMRKLYIMSRIRRKNAANFGRCQCTSSCITDMKKMQLTAITRELMIN